MTESEMNRIFRILFVIVSILVLLLFLGQVWKDRSRSYDTYQDEFGKLAAQKSAEPSPSNRFQTGIHQRWVEALNRADRCETCHLGLEDPKFNGSPEPFTTHPAPSLHSFEKFGCTICHGGQGPATTLKGAHGPTDNWKTALYHQDFMENSCPLCHGEFIDKKAPVYSSGRLIFNDYGCRGCHKVAGKPKTYVGPPLDQMGEKVKPDWLFRWIRNPKGYLPLTRMPNSKLSDQECADVAAFLLKEGKPETAEIPGDQSQGKATLMASRCVSCHSIEGKGGTLAPELSKVASKNYPRTLYRIIQNPHALWSESRMPIYGFPDQDLKNMVAFISYEYVDLDLDPDKASAQAKRVSQADAENGRKLIEKYACNGCHTKIKGIKERAEIAPELTAIGSVDLGLLDFGDIRAPMDERTVPNWLYNKVKQPRLFKEGLKMPDFSFSNLQAEAVTTCILSLKNEEVPNSYRLPLGEPPSSYSAQGAFGKILDKYRCLVCHKIFGKGGEMAPDLSQEGSRVKEPWLLKFMKAPDTIRPMLPERMPPFHIQDPEDAAIYAYCRSTLVDNRVEDLSGAVSKMALTDPNLISQGQKLYSEKYACNACHQIAGKGGVIGPDFTHVDQRLRPEWVVYYLHDPKAFVVRSIEPVYKFDEKEIEALTAFLVNPKTAPPAAQ